MCAWGVVRLWVSQSLLGMKMEQERLRGKGTQETKGTVAEVEGMGSTLHCGEAEEENSAAVVCLSVCACVMGAFL